MTAFGFGAVGVSVLGLCSGAGGGSCDCACFRGSWGTTRSLAGEGACLGAGCCFAVFACAGGICALSDMSLVVSGSMTIGVSSVPMKKCGLATKSSKYLSRFSVCMFCSLAKLSELSRCLRTSVRSLIWMKFLLDGMAFIACSGILRSGSGAALTWVGGVAWG